MSTGNSDLLSEALQLPASERLNLAAELLDSVEGKADPSWDAAWLAELDRRMEEADRDPSSLKEWSAVKRTLLEKLRQK